MKGFNILLIVLLTSIMVFTGCDDSGSSSDDSNAVMMSAIVENIPGSSCTTIVALTRNNVPINDAIVSLNGSDIPLWIAGSGVYYVAGSVITSGTSVTITVTGSNIDISETLVMPEAPVVTAPTSAGGPYDSTQTLNVAWNSFTTNPDLVMLEVSEDFTVSGEDYSEDEAGDAITHIIPANIINTGQIDVEVSVVSVMISFLGGAAYEADSLFMLGNLVKSEKFNTQ